MSVEDNKVNSTQPLFTKCPVCNSSNIIASGIVSYEGELRYCAQCNLLLNDCDEARYHASNAAWDTEGGTSTSGRALIRMHRRAKSLLKKALVHVGKKAEDCHILDIGSSTGDFLLYAKSLGFTVSGIELSQKASQTANSRGISTFNGLLEHADYEEGTFDIITMFNVIEHIATPADLLTDVLRIMKPGGVLLIETGNIDSWTMQYQQGKWHFFDMDRHGGHVCFHSPQSLIRLVENAGFRFAGITTSNVRFIEKRDSHPVLYRLASLVHELLQLPGRLLNKGHDMVVMFRKPPEG